PLARGRSTEQRPRRSEVGWGFRRRLTQTSHRQRCQSSLSIFIKGAVGARLNRPLIGGDGAAKQRQRGSPPPVREKWRGSARMRAHCTHSGGLPPHSIDSPVAMDKYVRRFLEVA